MFPHAFCERLSEVKNTMQARRFCGAYGGLKAASLYLVLWFFLCAGRALRFFE
jgi:hypothetical protein